MSRAGARHLFWQDTDPKERIFPVVRKMPYTALYRQWRPLTFADVIGQPHVTTTLQNALKAGTVGHAYLFAGPRGTGKTSVAKILSRVVNCTGGTPPEPCNKCPSCESILDGSATDVLEIDAASNRGIDEIRDLRNKVRFCPANLKRRVYIIDEVHMLTPEAFNALLKTLEEPPEHAMFILATTEPHKLPATVLSRCQRFKFHRIPTSEVAARLEGVTKSLRIAAGADALRAIARAADGSLRDAIGFLEQCASYAVGEISLADVHAVMGDAGPSELMGLVNAMAGGDVEGVIRGLDVIASGGRDFRQINRDLIQFLRNILVLKACKDPGDLVDEDPDVVRDMRTIASAYSEAEVMDAMSSLGELDSGLRHSTQPRILLEARLLRLADGRRTRLPQGVQSQPQVSPPQPSQPGEPPQPVEAVAPVDQKAVTSQTAATTPAPGLTAEGPEQPDKDGPPTALWQALIVHLKRERKANLAALLNPAQPVSLKADILTIAFGPESNFHKCRIESPENVRFLESVLKSISRRDIHITCTMRQPQMPSSDPVYQPDTEEGLVGLDQSGERSQDRSQDRSADYSTGDAGAVSEENGNRSAGGDPVLQAIEIFGGKVV